MPRLRKVPRYEYGRRTSLPFPASRDDDSPESESEGGTLDYNDASDAHSERDDEDTEPVADTSGPGFGSFTTASSTGNATTGRSFEDHDAHDDSSKSVDEEDADVSDTNFWAVDHDAEAELFDMVERNIRSSVEAGSGEPAQGVVDSLQSDADDDDQEGGEDFVHLNGESRQGGQDENDNVAGEVIDLTNDDEDQEEDEEDMEEDEDQEEDEEDMEEEDMIGDGDDNVAGEVIDLTNDDGDQEEDEEDMEKDEDQEEDEEDMEEEDINDVIGDGEDNEDGDDTEIGVWRGIVIVRCYRDGEHTLHVESDNDEGELLEDHGAHHEYSDGEDEEDDDASGANSESIRLCPFSF